MRLFMLLSLAMFSQALTAAPAALFCETDTTTVVIIQYDDASTAQKAQVLYGTINAESEFDESRHTEASYTLTLDEFVSGYALQLTTDENDMIYLNYRVDADRGGGWILWANSTSNTMPVCQKY